MAKRNGSIGFVEARALVGKALFRDDWIGELSKRDLDLLSGPYGPQRKQLANGRNINILSPCPPNLRNRLDATIGRAERAYLQEATVVDVLHDKGFRDNAKEFDAGKFQEFLADIGKPNTDDRKRTVGKPRDKIEGVKLRMASDMRAGRNLAAMKEKELSVRYGVSRGTARQARQEVLEKQTRE